MSDDESVPPKRPRGRPRAPEEGVKLTTYLRQPEVAKLRDKAARDGVTVSQCMRDLLFKPRT